MAANLLQVDPEPQLLFDGLAVLISGTKRNHRRIEDIISWVEAFTPFTTVLTSLFLHRWRDLTVYKLLICGHTVSFLGVCGFHTTNHSENTWPLPTLRTAPSSTYNYLIFTLPGRRLVKLQGKVSTSSPKLLARPQLRSFASPGIGASAPFPSSPASMPTCALTVLKPQGIFLFG